ncbi:MAG: tetratricopeptide repeat protein [Flavobacteriales bacterium]|nr:tetratricopeptide repeat protein [Flavobacteriales bacterium]
MKDLETAIRIAPENPDAWYYYANSLGRIERYDDALAAFERVNKLESQSLEGWMDHADLLMNVKGVDAALKKFREGEMVHKLNAKFKYRMVSYLLRAGREQQALLELEEALMADHASHTELLEHYPEAAHLPQVLHLLELYRR